MDDQDAAPPGGHGRPSLLAGTQRLIPDPLVAGIGVCHPGMWPAFAVVVAVATVVSDPPGATDRTGVVRAAIMVAVLVALWFPVGLLVDRYSTVRLGFWSGALAISEDRLYVVRTAWWCTGRPRSIAASFHRDEVVLSLGPQRTLTRTLTLTTPDGRTARLRVLRSDSVPARAAAPLVAAGPGARWAADPADPRIARLWDGSGWTQDTVPVAGLLPAGRPGT